MMENLIEKPQGLIARISTLLNNEVCSDVVFQVKHNNQKRMFYAHSPILLVAGNGFLDLKKQTSQPKIIKIVDFTPQIVEMMLTYLYTDELNILSMENAVNLYKLARMYSIDDLEKVCSNYITKEQVNIDNLFVKYESALSCNFPKLLEKCRHLVQSETKMVFASRYFGEAPFAVVEDIFSLNNLNVSSELDVIQAAFRWSASECRRKGRPTEKLCIRDAIDPLLKHLRFLSLSADDFCDFAAKDDNIFTAFETALLTRKILQPDFKGDFPKYLCHISEARQSSHNTNNHIVKTNSYHDLFSEPTNKNTSKDIFSVPINQTTFKDSYTELVNKTTFKDPNSELVNIKPYFKEPVQQNNVNSSYSESLYKNFNDRSELFSINFHDYKSEALNGNHSYNSFPEQSSSLKSDHGDTMFYRQSLERSPPALTKVVEQKTLFQYNQKKSTPMLKVMPQSQPSRQTFDFPLQELRKDMRFTSQRDVKCNVRIQMQTGAIFIYGIELKIVEGKNNPNETIVVHSCISNNHPSKFETTPLELKNNTISIMYPEPIRVALGNPTDIEITIEDLHLNRCFACAGRTYELNSGLNCKAEIFVKSNQSNGFDNVLYLISRIIYGSTN